MEVQFKLNFQVLPALEKKYNFKIVDDKEIILQYRNYIFTSDVYNWLVNDNIDNDADKRATRVNFGYKNIKWLSFFRKQFYKINGEPKKDYNISNQKKEN